SARKAWVAVAMGVVLAGSLALAWGFSSSQSALASLPAPDAWEQRDVPSSVPLRPVSWWTDPERPSRQLVAGYIQVRPPQTDLRVVLAKAVEQLNPLADAPTPTRDQVDGIATQRIVGARYRGIGEGRDGTVGQHLVTVLTSREGRFTRFLVLYLQDEFPADRPDILQENQRLMDELWSSSTMLP
ncbi:MAG: hypothetical protein ACOC3G_08755, partial [Phycisphaeraceae bacterium]